MNQKLKETGKDSLPATQYRLRQRIRRILEVLGLEKDEKQATKNISSSTEYDPYLIRPLSKTTSWMEMYVII